MLKRSHAQGTMYKREEERREGREEKGRQEKERKGKGREERGKEGKGWEKKKRKDKKREEKKREEENIRSVTSFTCLKNRRKPLLLLKCNRKEQFEIRKDIGTHK